MSCAQYNIAMCLTETFALDTVYNDSLGVPVDITGYGAEWVIGSTTFVAPNAALLVGPEAGTLHLKLTTAQVAALAEEGTFLPYTLTITNPALPVGYGDIGLLAGRVEID